jgi:soluble lytic murein transglycosylase-like protein
MEHVPRLEAVTLAKLPRSGEESSDRRIPWWAIALAAQVALSLPAALGAHRVFQKSVMLASAAEERAEEIHGIAMETKELTSQVDGLRQAVSSRAREEELYLKALILRPDLDPKLARAIATHTSRYCELYSRDPNLVLAIIAIESGFNPNARSSAGAVGLMQLMPQWKQTLGLKGDLTDPEVSIRAGLSVLGIYQDMYRNLETALTAYNRGPGAVDSALRRGEHPDNGYAPKVLATYERLRNIDATLRP